MASFRRRLASAAALPPQIPSIGYGALALGALALGLFEAAAGGGASPTLMAALSLAGVAGTAGALFGGPPAAGTSATPPAEDASPDAVCLLFDANGDVAEAFGPVRALMGLAPELLQGCGFFDRLHVVDRVSFMRAFAELRGGEERRRLELRVRLPLDAASGGDGVSGFLLDLSRNGDPRRPFAGRLRDHGEVARLKVELECAQAQAAVAEAERGRLLAGLAHELRTPLTAILGFSDILSSGFFGGAADGPQKEYVELIRQSGQHLLAVIDSMAHVATMEAGAAALEPEPFSVAEAVETCRAMLALVADAKGVRLKAEVSSACGTVTADRRTVQQVLVILLSNAVKFTPAGGEVAIRARRVGSRLHLSVSDTGCGIASGDLGRLGRPFVQVGEEAARKNGTGLGLALAKELVRRHDGALSIDSAPGEGTTVSLSLPAEWGAGAASLGLAAGHWNPNEDQHDALRKTA
ncbi:MAG TPA: HAMP domain-containing sensor histidine kinase [Mesorhizobium sp.]|nr:HAMP domain-containing sensor histidine kinase [Mesorhizobium sp.]